MFKAVVEQERIKKLLAGSIANHEVSHAYLFVGKKGMYSLSIFRKWHLPIPESGLKKKMPLTIMNCFWIPT